MNMDDIMPMGKPVQVPLPEKGKTLDYHKEIVAEEMIKSISYERILKAIINMEKDFVFNYITMDIKEVEKNKVFNVTYYYIPGDDSKFVEEDITVENELEGRKWHKMSKEPQNVVCIMIAKRIEGEEEWECSYVSAYNRGSNAKTAMELFTRLIESFMNWKDIKTIKKMMDYVENSERLEITRENIRKKYKLRKED